MTSDSDHALLHHVDAALLRICSLAISAFVYAGRNGLGAANGVRSTSVVKHGSISFEIDAARGSEQRQPELVDLQLAFSLASVACSRPARLFRVTRAKRMPRRPAGEQPEQPGRELHWIAPAG